MATSTLAAMMSDARTARMAPRAQLAVAASRETRHRDGASPARFSAITHLGPLSRCNLAAGAAPHSPGSRGVSGGAAGAWGAGLSLGEAELCQQLPAEGTAGLAAGPAEVPPLQPRFQTTPEQGVSREHLAGSCRSGTRAVAAPPGTRGWGRAVPAQTQRLGMGTSPEFPKSSTACGAPGGHCHTQDSFLLLGPREHH